MSSSSSSSTAVRVGQVRFKYLGTHFLRSVRLVLLLLELRLGRLNRRGVACLHRSFQRALGLFALLLLPCRGLLSFLGRRRCFLRLPLLRVRRCFAAPLLRPLLWFWCSASGVPPLLRELRVSTI